MSPLAVRRYRAERLLQAEFRRLQTRVTRVVARRLAAGGLALDGRDIEACYAMAWQGLYEAVIQGQQIANPAGWLVLVTYRRALDEQRARTRAGHRREPGGAQPPARKALGVDAATAGEEDFAETVDDRDLLRQLFEGLRARLSAPEREAAVLCYLHGLTRSQAAVAMGISERRMDRLMDGRGPGREGASGKLAMLVTSIREGRWCEQQASLMRGLAFGILDRRGERYRLALAHSSECPACRAYVASLRGLAAVLGPALLPRSLAGGILARICEGASAGTTHAGGAGVGGAGAVGSGSMSGAGSGSGAGVGAQFGSGGLLSGAGATGAGATGAGGAGGGWLLAGGSAGAKLAAGCLLALGVGAGCVALGTRMQHAPTRAHRHDAARTRSTAAWALPEGARATPRARAAALLEGPTAGASGERNAGTAAAGARAAREFGPEQASSAAAGRSRLAPLSPARAHVASSSPRHNAGGASREATGSVGTAPESGRPSSQSAGSGAEAQAQREFAPG